MSGICDVDSGVLAHEGRDPELLKELATSLMR